MHCLNRTHLYVGVLLYYTVFDISTASPSVCEGPILFLCQAFFDYLLFSCFFFYFGNTEY